MVIIIFKINLKHEFEFCYVPMNNQRLIRTIDYLDNYESLLNFYIVEEIIRSNANNVLFYSTANHPT